MLEPARAVLALLDKFPIELLLEPIPLELMFKRNEWYGMQILASNARLAISEANRP
jgi:hypothetical protein